MNIVKIAQQLINELSVDSAIKKAQAEGVALLYNKLVEASDAEAKEKVATEETK